MQLETIPAREIGGGEVEALYYARILRLVTWSMLFNQASVFSFGNGNECVTQTRRMLEGYFEDIFMNAPAL